LGCWTGWRDANDNGRKSMGEREKRLSSNNKGGGEIQRRFSETLKNVVKQSFAKVGSAPNLI